MALLPKPTSGKRVLLVEDERLVRESLRLLLLKDAHTVVEANNGAEGFSLFRTGQFDLVVTDYEMPFVKGNELAARIKHVAPRQPILMVTAYGHKRGADNPVDAVVNKPFDTAKLRELINELLAESVSGAGPQTEAFEAVSGSPCEDTVFA